MEDIKSKYLNWKCIDNFDRVPDKKLFLTHSEGHSLTSLQRAKLAPIFSELKKKWDKEIKDLFCDKRKTHLEISGGVYTFFYILPEVIKWARSRSCFLPISLSLFDRRESAALDSESADIILTAELLDQPYYQQIIEAKKNAYVVSKFFYNDSMFFASSKESVSLFGSQEVALQKQDILFTREYSVNNMYKLPSAFYVPKDRDKELARVILDQYFFGSTLINKSVGIGVIYGRMHKSLDLVRLTESPAAVFRRFVLYRESMKEYRWIGRSLMRHL